MFSKIKGFLKKYKTIIKILIVLMVLGAVGFGLYKLLFYSSAENSIYGVRLRDIKDNEFKIEEKKQVEEKVAGLEKVSTVKITIKGRLIKFFINFDEDVTNDVIKQRFNDALGFISDKVKGYYDITFYAKVNKGEEEKYPIIGYKHKNNTVISFDEL